MDEAEGECIVCGEPGHYPYCSEAREVVAADGG